jgi:hypothetical protein
MQILTARQVDYNKRSTSVRDSLVRRLVFE